MLRSIIVVPPASGSTGAAAIAAADKDRKAAIAFCSQLTLTAAQAATGMLPGTRIGTAPDSSSTSSKNTPPDSPIPLPGPILRTSSIPSLAHLALLSARTSIELQQLNRTVSESPYSSQAAPSSSSVPGPTTSMVSGTLPPGLTMERLQLLLLFHVALSTASPTTASSPETLQRIRECLDLLDAFRGGHFPSTSNHPDYSEVHTLHPALSVARPHDDSPLMTSIGDPSAASRFSSAANLMSPSPARSSTPAIAPATVMWLSTLAFGAPLLGPSLFAPLLNAGVLVRDSSLISALEVLQLAYLRIVSELLEQGNIPVFYHFLSSLFYPPCSAATLHSMRALFSRIASALSVGASVVEALHVYNGLLATGHVRLLQLFFTVEDERMMASPNSLPTLLSLVPPPHAFAADTPVEQRASSLWPFWRHYLRLLRQRKAHFLDYPISEAVEALRDSSNSNDVTLQRVDVLRPFPELVPLVLFLCWDMPEFVSVPSKLLLLRRLGMFPIVEQESPSVSCLQPLVSGSQPGSEPELLYSKLQRAARERAFLIDAVLWLRDQGCLPDSTSSGSSQLEQILTSLESQRFLAVVKPHLLQLEEGQVLQRVDRANRLRKLASSPTAAISPADGGDSDLLLARLFYSLLPLVKAIIHTPAGRTSSLLDDYSSLTAGFATRLSSLPSDEARLSLMHYSFQLLFLWRSATSRDQPEFCLPDLSLMQSLIKMIEAKCNALSALTGAAVSRRDTFLSQVRGLLWRVNLALELPIAALSESAEETMLRSGDPANAPPLTVPSVGKRLSFALASPESLLCACLRLNALPAARRVVSIFHLDSPGASSDSRRVSSAVVELSIREREERTKLQLLSPGESDYKNILRSQVTGLPTPDALNLLAEQCSLDPETFVTESPESGDFPARNSSRKATAYRKAAKELISELEGSQHTSPDPLKPIRQVLTGALDELNNKAVSVWPEASCDPRIDRATTELVNFLHAPSDSRSVETISTLRSFVAAASTTPSKTASSPVYSAPIFNFSGPRSQPLQLPQSRPLLAEFLRFLLYVLDILVDLRSSSNQTDQRTVQDSLLTLPDGPDLLTRFDALLSREPGAVLTEIIFVRHRFDVGERLSATLHLNLPSFMIQSLEKQVFTSTQFPSIHIVKYLAEKVHPVLGVLVATGWFASPNRSKSLSRMLLVPPELAEFSVAAAANFPVLTKWLQIQGMGRAATVPAPSDPNDSTTDSLLRYLVGASKLKEALETSDELLPEGAPDWIIIENLRQNAGTLNVVPLLKRIRDVNQQIELLFEHHTSWPLGPVIDSFRLCDSRLSAMAVKPGTVSPQLITRVSDRLSLLLLFQELFSVFSEQPTPEISLNPGESANGSISAASWRQLEARCTADPASVARLLVQRKKYALVQRFVRVFKLTDLRSEIEEEYLLDLLSSDEGAASAAGPFLQKLGQEALPLCRAVLPKLSSLSSRLFLVQFILHSLRTSLTSEESLRLTILQLGLQVVLKLPSVLHPFLQHLASSPLLIVETLIINQELRLAASVCRDFPAVCSRNLILSYACKALRFHSKEQLLLLQQQRQPLRRKERSTGTPAAAGPGIITDTRPSSPAIPASGVPRLLRAVSRTGIFARSGRKLPSFGSSDSSIASPSTPVPSGSGGPPSTSSPIPVPVLTPSASVPSSTSPSLHSTPDPTSDPSNSVTPTTPKPREKPKVLYDLSNVFTGLPDADWEIRDTHFFETAPSLELCKSILALFSDSAVIGITCLAIAETLAALLVEPQFEHSASVIRLVQHLLVFAKFQFLKADSEPSRTPSPQSSSNSLDGTKIILEPPNPRSGSSAPRPNFPHPSISFETLAIGRGLVESPSSLNFNAAQGAILCDTYLGYVELLRTLTQAEIPHLTLSFADLADRGKARVLRDRLIEEDRPFEAIEVCAKAGVDAAPVWVWWGRKLLRLGEFAEARTKFARCLARTDVPGTHIPVGASQRHLASGSEATLLEDIVKTLESTTTPSDLASIRKLQVSTLQQVKSLVSRTTTTPHDDDLDVESYLKALYIGPSSGPASWIQQGGPAHLSAGTASSLKDEQPTSIDPLRFRECLFYLRTYGAARTLVGFMIRHHRIFEALSLILLQSLSGDLFHAEVLLYYANRDDLASLWDHLRRASADPNLLLTAASLLSDSYISISSSPVASTGSSPSAESMTMTATGGSSASIFPVPQSLASFGDVPARLTALLFTSCQHLTAGGRFHELYQTQLYMKDNVRAGLTCIKLFQGADTYADKLTHLERAETHLQAALEQGGGPTGSNVSSRGPTERTALSEESSSQSSPSDLPSSRPLSDIEVSRQLSTVRLQREVTTFMAQKRKEQSSSGTGTASLPLGATPPSSHREDEDGSGTAGGSSADNSIVHPKDDVSLFGTPQRKCEISEQLLVLDNFDLSFRVIVPFRLPSTRIFANAAIKLLKKRQHNQVGDLLKNMKGIVSEEDLDDIVLQVLRACSGEGMDGRTMEKYLGRLVLGPSRVRGMILCGKFKASYLEAVKLHDAQLVMELRTEALRGGAAAAPVVALCDSFLSKHFSS